MKFEDVAWLITLFVGVLFGLAYGLMGGVQGERGYQCDKVGGQMIAEDACVKGTEVVIRWP